MTVSPKKRGVPGRPPNDGPTPQIPGLPTEARTDEEEAQEQGNNGVQPKAPQEGKRTVQGEAEGSEGSEAAPEKVADEADDFFAEDGWG